MLGNKNVPLNFSNWEFAYIAFCTIITVVARKISQYFISPFFSNGTDMMMSFYLTFYPNLKFFYGCIF